MNGAFQQLVLRRLGFESQPAAVELDDSFQPSIRLLACTLSLLFYHRQVLSHRHSHARAPAW